MAYITTEEVRAIRNALKVKFPNTKFSVRKNNYSMVDVSILSSNIDFTNVLFTSTWGDEEPEPVDNIQINTYHCDEKHYGEFTELFSSIIDVMKTAPATVEGGREWFDKSDSMTDYFHTAYYMSLSVGKWDKPYKMVA